MDAGGMDADGGATGLCERIGWRGDLFTSMTIRSMKSAMNFRARILICVMMAGLVSGCIGGHRMDKEGLRRENPERYRKLVRSYRAGGVSDDVLRKMGFKVLEDDNGQDQSVWQLSPRSKGPSRR